jgi:acetylglutamate kinase
MALLEPGARGVTYLSKFAVLPFARGEGLGQDLWWEMRKDTPELYWRSRPDNPINGFYLSTCDGVHKTQDWHVYYCGVDAGLVPDLVADALARPVDLKA